MQNSINAVETAPLIERAFAAGRVDEAICDDWETVRVELGLQKVPGKRAQASGQKKRQKKK